VEINERVKVSITYFDRYAMGAAESLNGKTGKIIDRKVESVNGMGSRGPAYLVEFDTNYKKWWTNHRPNGLFWFPPSELIKEKN